MTPTSLLLSDRRDEFEQHWSVVSFLEMRSGESLGIVGGGNLERRHIAISKAGLLIHLYNITEAVMTFQLQEVMSALSGYRPSMYADCVLREWIKEQAGTHVSMGEDKRLDKSLVLANIIAGRAPVQTVTAPKAPGNWDDDKIDKIAKRLGCRIGVSAQVKRAARSSYFNGKSRMYYVKKRRNDLAHGTITFEDGGREKTLAEIRDIADANLNYLEAVVLSFDSYIANSEFLLTVRT